MQEGGGQGGEGRRTKRRSLSSAATQEIIFVQVFLIKLPLREDLQRLLFVHIIKLTIRKVESKNPPKTG